MWKPAEEGLTLSENRWSFQRSYGDIITGTLSVFSCGLRKPLCVTENSDAAQWEKSQDNQELETILGMSSWRDLIQGLRGWGWGSEIRESYHWFPGTRKGKERVKPALTVSAAAILKAVIQSLLKPTQRTQLPVAAAGNAAALLSWLCTSCFLLLEPSPPPHWLGF